MEIINKPDLKVFASEAKSGEIAQFPDVLRGWGITFEQTQGKPPLEWMNDAFNRVDLNNLYLLQQGIPEWQKEIKYPENSFVKREGKLYFCLVENENNEPSQYPDKWSLLIKKATTSQQGIVQLTNTIDASQDKAITPFAVNELQKAIEQAITEATEVPVDKIFAFDTATPPKGYIARNGQAIDQATMPKLYARYGANMPDDRDRALRMSGALAGTAGSTQEDAMQKITGSFISIPIGETNVIWSPSGAFHQETGSIGSSSVAGETKNARINVFDSSKSPDARTATETRAKSRIAIFCNKIQ